MKLAISKEYYKEINLTIINAIIVFALWFFLQIDTPLLRTAFIAILFFLYLLYFLKLNILLSLKNYIMFSSLLYFLFTLSYRHFIGNCGIDYLRLADILLFVLFFKSIVDKNIGFSKYLYNKFSLIYILMVVLGVITGILNGATFENIFKVSWIYLRLLPVYIILVYGRVELSAKSIRWYVFLNIVSTLVLTPLCINGLQDDMAGLFGFCGIRAFSFLAIASYSYAVYNYVFNNAKTSYIILASILYYGWCALGENKVPLLFGLVQILLAFIVKRKNKDVRVNFRKFFLVLSVLFVTIFAYNLLLRFHPEWNIIQELGVVEFVKSYTQSQQVGYIKLGRMTVIQWIFTNIFGSFKVALFGSGIGNAMPSDLANYHIMKYIMNRNTVDFHDWFITPFYNKYGWSLGYHNSGLAILFLEVGIVGVMLFFLAITSLIVSWRYFFKKQNHSIRIYGFVGIVVLIYYVLTFVYYDPIFQYNCQFIIFIILGIVEGKRHQTKGLYK